MAPARGLQLSGTVRRQKMQELWSYKQHRQPDICYAVQLIRQTLTFLVANRATIHHSLVEELLSRLTVHALQGKNL